MPAIAEPIIESAEMESIQTALKVSDYLNQAQYADSMTRNRLYSRKSIILDYVSELTATLLLLSFKKKLSMMNNLRANWDTYGAEPPSEESKQRAADLISFLLRDKIIPTDVIASSEGGVAISFTSAERYADIECLNSGEVLAVTVRGHETPDVWEVEPNEAAIARTIERIREHIAA